MRLGRRRSSANRGGRSACRPSGRPGWTRPRPRSPAGRRARRAAAGRCGAGGCPARARRAPSAPGAHTRPSLWKPAESGWKPRSITASSRCARPLGRHVGGEAEPGGAPRAAPLLADRERPGRRRRARHRLGVRHRLAGGVPRLHRHRHAGRVHRRHHPLGQLPPDASLHQHRVVVHGPRGYGSRRRCPLPCGHGPTDRRPSPPCGIACAHICDELPDTSDKISHGELAWSVGPGTKARQFATTWDHHHDDRNGCCSPRRPARRSSWSPPHPSGTSGRRTTAVAVGGHVPRHRPTSTGTWSSCTSATRMPTWRRRRHAARG